MATQVKTGLIANNAITDAKIANVALTGVTASSGDSSTSLATTAFVAGEINSLIDSAPGALNTLNELAAAMGDDANFSTTVTNNIATKLPLAGGALTGDLSTNSRVAIGQSSFTGGGVLLDLHSSGSSVGSQAAFYNDHNTSGFFVGIAGNSTGNPLLYNSPDTNIEFYTNSAIAMTITSSETIFAGNVGIGENSPDGELHVKGTGGGNGDVYVERTSGAKIHLQAQSANGKIGTSSNHNLGLNTNGSTRIDIDSGGDVKINTGRLGIGMDAAQALDIDRTSGLSLRFYNSGTFKGGLQAVSGSGQMIGTSAADDFAIRSQSNLLFSAGGNTERMRINSGNGFVGIGTGANPRYNLTVEGNNSTAVGIGVDNVSGSSTLDIAALGTGYANHQAAGGEVWFFSPDNINIGGATGHTNDIKFIANNSVNMIIKGNGKVGVGTTTVSDGKFIIQGDSSYVGNYGYSTLVLQDTSGYPGLNLRNGNNNWLIRNDGSSGAFQIVNSANASAQGVGSYDPKLEISGTTTGRVIAKGGTRGRYVAWNATSGDGDDDVAVALKHDWNSWIDIFHESWVGNSSGWGTFWAGSAGAAYRRDSGDGNPNEFVFVGSGQKRYTFELNPGGALTSDGPITGNYYDYAEYFEWEDGNPDNEDRRGFTVTLTNDGLIRKATSDDDPEEIIGVISGTSQVVGDSAAYDWNGRYEIDEWGTRITDDVVTVSWSESDENGETTNHSYLETEIPDNLTVPNDAMRKHHKAYRETSDYDSEQVYVPRDKRKEWGIVGLVGKVRVRDESPKNPRWKYIKTIADKKLWLIR